MRDRTPTLPLPYEAIRWAERGYSDERTKDIAGKYEYEFDSPTW